MGEEEARINRIVAQNVIEARLDRECPQEGLAAALGIDLAALAAIEAGRVPLSAGGLYRIACALEMELGAFYDTLGLPPTHSIRGFTGCNTALLGPPSAETVALARAMEALSPRVRTVLHDSVAGFAALERRKA